MKIIAIITSVSIIAASVSGCTKQPDKVEAKYIDDAVYRNQSCGQLMSQRNAVVHEVNRLTKQQKTAADTDAAMVGVSLVLFWPAAFALLLTEDESAELAQKKGEYEAITRRMEARGCKIPTPQTVPDKKT